METEIILNDWAQQWLEYRRCFVKESTFASYQMQFKNHILPALGEKKLSEIDERSIQDAVLHWLASGRLDGAGGLSEGTVRNTVMVLKLCLKAAMRERIIPKFEPEILFPRSERIDRLKVLSEEDQLRVVRAVREKLTPKSLGILLCLNTGIRIGELCALQWRDIDIERRTVHISKTLQRVSLSGGSSKVIITTPKTRSSVREIPLSGAVVSALSELGLCEGDIYLLTGAKNHLEPRSYRWFYDAFIRRLGIEPINFHGLRHTFATRCIEAGADYKTVSQLLGHSAVSTTMNLYVHPQMEQKRRCVELIGAYM